MDSPSATDAIAGLQRDLQRYAHRWPAESPTVGHFIELLAEIDAPFTRERLDGHFTGSAWLVDRTGTRVLLTHHRKLGRWLQLGGHADGDADLANVALKEAGEESGLGGLTLEPGIFDLDRHWIPARGDVPAHWHYDVRYVVRAGADEAFVVSEESLDLAWRDIRELRDDPASDESVQRMSTKWLERGSR